jgi:hypothetical protein
MMQVKSAILTGTRGNKAHAVCAREASQTRIWDPHVDAQ